MSDGYQGLERRQRADVSRSEFCELKSSVARIETAMFAKDDDNEFDSPGLMVVAKRMNDHIDAVCNIARWARNFVIGTLAIAAPAVAIAKALGWL
jgi:hypothetical protein